MKKILIVLAGVVAVAGLGFGGYKLATRNKNNNNDTTNDAPAQPEATKEGGDPAPAAPAAPEAPAPEAENTDEKK